jgi:hypothetical protein
LLVPRTGARPGVPTRYRLSSYPRKTSFPHVVIPAKAGIAPQASRSSTLALRSQSDSRLRGNDEQKGGYSRFPQPSLPK